VCELIGGGRLVRAMLMMSPPMATTGRTRPRLLELAWLLAGASVCACAPPALTRDGQLVFSERARSGAAVLTANGIEIVDRNHLPPAIVRSSAFEPWRPPTGFLLPGDGVFRQTSTAHPIDARGMAVVVRTSDVLVPAWGGEVLIRLDAIVPVRAHTAQQSSVRAPVRLAIVLDDDGGSSLARAEEVVDALGAHDRIAVIDSARGARRALPLVPGSHRSLIEGSIERALAQRRLGRRPRDLAAALALAQSSLGTGRQPPIVLVLTDGRGVRAQRARLTDQLRRLSEGKIRVIAIGAGAERDRHLLETFSGEVLGERGIESLLDPPGDTVLSDVTISFSSAPAPARLIESSSGELAMALEEDTLDLGDLYVGEARTEVVRLAVPAWTPGESYDLRVAVTHRDAAGRRWRARRTIPMVYSDDIVQLAEQRHGDVIAYASALAMVRRLERVFLGRRAAELGGLRPIVRAQADSMALLARERGDRSLARQAEVLGTLLDAVDD
jgi:hypothetical protein